MDQRSVHRPQESHCDIGAYELAPTTKTLSVSATALVCGQTLKLTSTIFGVGGIGVPSGFVRFLDGNQALGSASLGMALLAGGGLIGCALWRRYQPQR